MSPHCNCKRTRYRTLQIVSLFLNDTLKSLAVSYQFISTCHFFHRQARLYDKKLLGRNSSPASKLSKAASVASSKSRTQRQFQAQQRPKNSQIHFALWSTIPST